MNNGIEPGSVKLSNDATAIIDHIKTHYKNLGKTMAAQNYSRHVRRFFEWAESNGMAITNLPSDAPERFIQAQGHKATTEYVLRTQLRSALKEAHVGLGANFGHLEYEANKAPEVIKAQVDRAKARNQEKKLRKQAIEIGIDPETVPALKESKKKLKERATEVFNATAAKKLEAVTAENFQDLSFDSFAEVPMAAPEVYAESVQVNSTPAPAPVVSAAPQQTVVSGGNGQAPTFIINTTPTGVSPSGRPTNTIANAVNGVNPAARGPLPSASAPSKTVLINNQTFSGPFIKINRIADGSEPLIPPGTETFVTTIPTAQVAPHGDVAGFLQNYLIPSMRLSPMVSQVHFVFHELNDKRSPTGRRDELIVAVPSMGGYQNGYQGGQSFGGQPFGGGYGFAPPPQQAPQSPVVVQLEQPSISGMATPVNVQPPRGDDKFDRATEILLKKLDREADDARQRAQDLERKLMESRDTQTTFLLMQQMQKENEMRQKLEDQKREAVAQQDRMQEEERRRNEREEMRRMMELQMQNNRPSYEPPPWAMTPPPPAPQVEVMPRPDSSAEMAKAFAESQAKMMEAMMNGLAAARNVPLPPPPPPQKDAAEWLVPMMTQMTSLQQAQAQAQAAAAQRQQEMMMQMQAENMKLVIAMQSSQAQAAQASNDKMMQMFMGLQQRESPETAVLREQLRQSQQQVAGLSQREDEIDTFLQKYQQIQQMTEIVKGGGATNLLGGIVENFGQIAQGAAHIMGAMNAQKAGTAAAAAPAPMPMPMAQPQAQQLAGVPTPQPLPSPKAPEPVGEVKPPDECIKALESIAATQDEEEMVNGFVEYMKGLNTSSDKLFQVQLERVLKVFQQCEDDEDVYTLCKQLWIIMGLKADKAAAKKLASAITKWYPLIHKSFFGEARMLPNIDKPLAPDVVAALEGGADVTEEAGDDEEGEDEEDEEEDGDAE